MPSAIIIPNGGGSAPIIAEANNNAGQALTINVTDVIWTNEVYDPSGIYNPASGAITAPSNGTLLWVNWLRSTTSVAQRYQVYLDTIANSDGTAGATLSNAYALNNFYVRMTAGQVATVRSNTALTLQTTAANAWMLALFFAD